MYAEHNSSFHSRALELRSHAKCEELLELLNESLNQVEQLLPDCKKPYSVSYRHCTEWFRSLWFDARLNSAGQEVFFPNEKAKKHINDYGNAAASKSMNKIETPDDKSRAQIKAIFKGQKVVTKCMNDILTYTKATSETLLADKSLNRTQKRILSDANIEDHRQKRLKLNKVRHAEKEVRLQEQNALNEEMGGLMVGLLGEVDDVSDTELGATDLEDSG